MAGVRVGLGGGIVYTVGVVVRGMVLAMAVARRVRDAGVVVILPVSVVGHGAGWHREVLEGSLLVIRVSKVGVVVAHEAMRSSLAGNMRSAGRVLGLLPVHICLGLCLVRPARRLRTHVSNSVLEKIATSNVVFARRGPTVSASCVVAGSHGGRAGEK